MRAPQTNAGSVPRQLVPAGTHAARIYSIIDLGTHQVEYQGESKAKRLVRLGWELLDETIEIQGENKPMVIGKEFTFSLHEKAGLRKAIESMMGKPIKDSDVPTFDLECLIGIPVLLGVVHEQSQAGNSYAKITSYSPPMKSMKPRALSLEKQVFELLPSNYEAFKALPLWTKRKIKEAKETPKDWDPEATIDAKEDGDEIPF
jgi:hypothetical protein